MNNANRYLIRIVWAPGLVVVFHIVATLAGWYRANWWFDMPLHFLGGVAIAFSAYQVLEYFSQLGKYKNEFKPLQILVLLAFTGLAAVGWEFMEYMFDTYAQTHLQSGLLDTIKDLSIGLIGGALSSLTLVLRNRK